LSLHDALPIYDERRESESDRLACAGARDEPVSSPPPGHELRETDRDADRDAGEERDPPDRDRDPFHGRKRNARHQRRARIEGVSFVRTGTRTASLIRSPSRYGTVPNRAAAERLPVRIAS